MAGGKKAQSSSMLITLGGPAILLCLYAVNVRLNPSDAAKQVARLEGQLETVKAGEIPFAQSLQVAEQLRLKQEQLDDAKLKLDEVRRQASEMMRGDVDGMEELALGKEVNRVLTVAGLRLVDDHPVAADSRGNRMLKTLADATKQLGETLTEQMSKEADNTPIQLPSDLPRDVNPVEWMAAQRELRTGRFDGPQTRSSQLKLVGDYRAMVAGLEAVVDTCPGVVVTSVAFEKPTVRTPGSLPLIWNIEYQMRPLPKSLSSDIEMTDVVQQQKLNANANASADRQTDVQPDTYMVAKPIVRGAD